MPEGHLLHRAAASQGALFDGQRVWVTSPQGKFADGAHVVDGARCDGVWARGKHLFYRFDDARLHVHLGLRGFFVQHAAPPPEPVGWVRMRLAVPAGAVDLLAPARCELLDDAGVSAIEAKLGPDPLGDDDAAEAVRRLRSFRGPVGAALLDQGMWAGLGNAFRTELLYLARIPPSTLCSALAEKQAAALWESAREQMRIGMRLGVIATVDGETDAKWVYKQETCRGCGAPVESTTIAARLVYWCTAEQRRSAA